LQDAGSVNAAYSHCKAVHRIKAPKLSRQRNGISIIWSNPVFPVIQIMLVPSSKFLMIVVAEIFFPSPKH